MGSCNNVEEDRFFDSRDEVSSISDLGSNSSEALLSPGMGNCTTEFDVWANKPDSVNERRDKFLKWMGLGPDWHVTYENEVDDDSWPEITRNDTYRLRNNEETSLESLERKPLFFSSRSFQSLSQCDTADLEVDVDKSLIWRIKNLDNGTEFIVDEITDDCTRTTFREVGSDKMLSFDEFQKTHGSSGLVQRFLRKEKEVGEYNKVDSKKKVSSSWIRKFNEMAHIANRVKRAFHVPNQINSSTGLGSRRMQVDVCSKNSKELTSLYPGQEFPAHEGSILTMKFSPDGHYLASAGEDGIVRVWKVLEDDTVGNFDVQDVDPSCLYFSLNHFSKLPLVDEAKEKDDQNKKSKKSSDSACVILPQKVFHLMEKPFHEFHGHEGEVLALSWSENGHLLSSSVDKTVRLWRLGNDHCVRIFSHNNYVTCVDFNLVDDNYFISGSIDGKLRIWEIQGCRVIDWTDIREIITAVCYSPDGKGVVVGSMYGNCRFYDVIDNRLQLSDEICLKGKKLAGKRITAFQFCPSDASKVVVTSADSQVRILRGTNVIGKFKGNHSSGSTSPASFTSDGNHVVSATEDSKVHVWTCNGQSQKPSRPKSLSSRESFLSHNASIAIPWCGLRNKIGAFGFFLDSLYRASATWPEEKLPKSRPGTVNPSTSRSEFKFLKNAWLNALNSPHLWGLVIVTAGWDGCIRTFLNHGLPIRF